MTFGIHSVLPTDIVVLENGNYYLIGTVVLIEYGVYAANHILVSLVHLGDDERFEWTKKILRRFSGISREVALHSYNYLVQGNKINIFYYGGMHDLDAASALKPYFGWYDVLISVRLDDDEEENDIYRSRVTENQYDLTPTNDYHELLGVRITKYGEYIIGKIAFKEE